MWEDTKIFFKRSLTILFARVTAASGVLLALFADLTQNATTDSAFRSILKPEYLPYYFIVTGLLFELARRRTVGKATDENNKVL